MLDVGLLDPLMRFILGRTARAAAALDLSPNDIFVPAILLQVLLAT